jgi:hypothetical protein
MKWMHTQLSRYPIDESLNKTDNLSQYPVANFFAL